MNSKDCFYCWMAGRVAPWVLLALAALLWLLPTEPHLKLTALWLVVFAVFFGLGSWVLARFGRR